MQTTSRPQGYGVRTSTLGTLLLVVLAAAPNPARAQSCSGLGELGNLGGTGPHARSSAFGVSADGRTVVGSSPDSSNQDRAFRWTTLEGIAALPTFGAGTMLARGVGADGAVIVGGSSVFPATGAWIWRSGTGFEALPGLGGPQTDALAVSADGLTVVGRAQTITGAWRAFRWTALDGMVDLGPQTETARAVSADGSVIVGTGTFGGTSQAFRWTAGGGAQPLGTAGHTWSEGSGVSADGSLVVGRFVDPQANPEMPEFSRPFRWTAASGFSMPWYEPARRVLDVCVSADGQVLAATQEVGFNLFQAVRWTAVGGLETPVSGLSWHSSAAALSADGSVLVGTLQGPGPHRAFRWSTSLADIVCAQPAGTGCAPSLGLSGSASLSAAQPCRLSLHGAPSAPLAIFFYGLGSPIQAASPYGTLCAGPPHRRIHLANVGGTGGPCAAVFELDFNAHLASGSDPALIVGTEVVGHFWHRDPSAPASARLSPAVRLRVCP